MALFDAYMMVDWSAAAKRCTGKDSIWICMAARNRMADLFVACRSRGQKLLAGFDFPFGYPQGFAGVLGLKGPAWRAAWDELDRLIEDGDDNANNRFAVAAALNRRLGKPGPFWGCPSNQACPSLTTTKPAAYGKGRLAEWRIGESYISGLPCPQPVWKLFYPGSVGSQTLMGLPVVSALRRDDRFKARIWPFETGLKTLTGKALRDCDVVLAEIYPSLVSPRPADSAVVKDALQVQAMVGYLKALDDRDALGSLFAGADNLSQDERRTVETEEAWILGVTEPDTKSGRIDVDVDHLFVDHGHGI